MGKARFAEYNGRELIYVNGDKQENRISQGALKFTGLLPLYEVVGGLRGKNYSKQELLDRASQIGADFIIKYNGRGRATTADLVRVTDLNLRKGLKLDEVAESGKDKTLD